MKRLIMVAATLATMVMSAFANVELDLNMYGVPLCQYNLDTDFGDTKVKLENPIGFDTKWGFMIGAPVPFCDIGIKFDYAFDFFWNINSEINVHGKSVDNDENVFALGTNFTLGPLVRFNLGDWHTIYVSPGLMAKCHLAWGDEIYIGEDGDSDAEFEDDNTRDRYLIYSGIGLAFDLDIGYRIWLINRTGFHFGLNVGLDMNWPLIMKFWTKTFDGDSNVLPNDNGEYKIYFGFCFNFGDKSPDKHR